MAHSFRAIATAKTSSSERLVAVLFVSFLLVCFVGFHPLGHIEDLAIDDTGGSDVFRQLAFSVLGVLTASIALVAPGKWFVRLFSVPIVLTMFWCFLSAFWSPVPDISVRRLALAIIILTTVFACVSVLHATRSSRLLAYTLIGIIALSIGAGLISPDAKHQAWHATNQALVGDWRGLFPHKNDAGAASAILIILCVFFYATEQRWIWLLGLVLGAILLVLSSSKTSMGVLVPALAIGLLYSHFLKMKNGRRLYVVFCFLLTWLAILLLVVYQQSIANTFDDPEAFTGRTQIWGGLTDAIEAHPWWGFGYDSLFMVGIETPLLDYAPSWVVLMSHGHNGYLELMATVGLVGLTLALWAFVIQPIYVIISTDGFDRRWVGLVISLTVFFLLHNMMETSLLKGARMVWVVMLVAIATVRRETIARAVANRGRFLPSRLRPSLRARSRT